MISKTSRTSWTARGFGEMYERRHVTEMKPWNERECAVRTQIRKD